MTPFLRQGRAGRASHQHRTAGERSSVRGDSGRGRPPSLRAAFDGLSQGVLVLDRSLRIVHHNRRLPDLLGLPAGLALRGRTLAWLRRQACPVAGDSVGPRRAALRLPEHGLGRDGPVPCQLTLPDGRSLELRVSEAGRRGWVVAVDHGHEGRAADAEAQQLAYRDPLTELPNRRLFHDSLVQSLARAQRGGEAVAVMCLDLDRFKLVNDTLGHSVGDALLKLVAERLRSLVRATDTVARLGGDEFAVVHVAADQPRGAEALAKRLIDLLGRPYLIDGHLVNIGVSIGVALAPGDGDDPERLLRSADLALYRAKADGRGTACFFAPEMDARMQARRSLELDLRKALALREFALHYQPKLNLQTGRVAAFEALLRWQHPERGLVSPGDFIPLAEEIGLIVPIGEWVLRAACRDAATWPDGIAVAVNLSPAQFKSSHLIKAVRDALASSGLDPARLEIEITEGVLLQDSAFNLDILRQLKALGVSVAMDDFGTGYSSLSYLRSFPFDRIKIDRSFVNDLASGNDAAAIVRAIASMGASLGMSLTAEGVETVEQMRHLRAEGCDEIQGYLISRPVPASEVLALIAGHFSDAA